MCGIAGRVNLRSGAPVSPALLTAMCDTLRHRGPDGDGVWTDGPVGFGHRRLAVIDLSDAGRQPMHTADGRLSITFNGEIYNFRDIRHELEGRGARFCSRSDTEVLLEAYRAWGPDCLGRLRGMFAFAVWDHDARRLFAARDRLGQKPFYYRLDRDGLSFASEPKAFLPDPAFRAEPDPTALFHYLSFQYVPSPSSAFRGLTRLPPGHSLTLDEAGLRVDAYWRPSYEPKHEWDDETATEAVLEHLREAVRLRLISDVPLGAFLSGGIDSSLIVALMAEQASGSVKTFSIGFDQAAYNELPWARLVADRFGTAHHELIVRPDALAILPTLVWHYNEPFADSSAIPTMYLAELTRQHVTVALTGDGGDENFAGYDRYRASRLAARLDRLPLGARRVVARAAARLHRGPSRATASRVLRLLEAAADSPGHRYAHWLFHFNHERKQTLCRPEFLAQVGGADSADRLDTRLGDHAPTGPLDRLLALDVATYLPDDLLVKVDIATMAVGLEGRSPLLDHHLVECAARLPEHLKLAGRTQKAVLKRLAHRLLPSAITHRPKMGFGVPLDRWFRHDLHDLTRDVLLGPSLDDRGYFHRAVVERMVAEHQSGTRDWHHPLWNLLMFELWHRRFIDGGASGV